MNNDTTQKKAKIKSSNVSSVAINSDVNDQINEITSLYVEAPTTATITINLVKTDGVFTTQTYTTTGTLSTDQQDASDTLNDNAIDSLSGEENGEVSISIDLAADD